MVYFRPMGALGDTSLLSVFHQLQLHLGRRCALDVPSQHLTIQLPCRVPIGERYSLLDLYFACATMDTNREVFVDDHRILQLVVITTPPSPSITWKGRRKKEKIALPLVDLIAGRETWLVLCGHLLIQPGPLTSLQSTSCCFAMKTAKKVRRGSFWSFSPCTCLVCFSVCFHWHE